MSVTGLAEVLDSDLPLAAAEKQLLRSTASYTARAGSMLHPLADQEHGALAGAREGFAEGD